MVKNLPSQREALSSNSNITKKKKKKILPKNCTKHFHLHPRHNHLAIHSWKGDLDVQQSLYHVLLKLRDCY
jgi:hypothetical protein